MYKYMYVYTWLAASRMTMKREKPDERMVVRVYLIKKKKKKRRARGEATKESLCTWLDDLLVVSWIVASVMYMYSVV